MCMCGKNNKRDEDIEIVKNEEKSNHNKQHTKRIPHLKAVNGKVEIEPNDPEQVKWFQEFKK